MKHSRFCSKCGSNDILIFKGNDLWPHVRKNVLIRWLTRDKSVHLDRYVCENCGYVAFWVDETKNIDILKPHFKPHFFAPKIARRDSFLTRHIIKTLETLVIGQIVDTKLQIHGRLNKTNHQLTNLQHQLTEELMSINQQMSKISNRIHEIEKRLSDIDGKSPST